VCVNIHDLKLNKDEHAFHLYIAINVFVMLRFLQLCLYTD